MRFFFYGTLVAGSGNAAARAAHRLLMPLGPATTAGLLHALPDPAGWYPALTAGAGLVHGAAYAAPPGFDPAPLDAWEDCDPADPAASLYRREEAAVRLARGEDMLAWRYVWHPPLPAGAVALPHGNFARFLAERGARAFGEG